MHYGIKNELTGKIIAAHPIEGFYGKCKMECLASRENKNRRKVRGKLIVVSGVLNAGGFFESDAPEPTIPSGYGADSE